MRELHSFEGYRLRDLSRRQRLILAYAVGLVSTYLADELPDTLVLEHDATDVDFLLGEQIDRADAVVATADSDEKNLLVSLLVKDIGVRRTVAIVEEGKYTDLFEAVGVDVAINPREATAEEIIRFTEEGQIENLSLIENHQTEVLEFQVDDDEVMTVV